MTEQSKGAKLAEKLAEGLETAEELEGLEEAREAYKALSAEEQREAREELFRLLENSGLFACWLCGYTGELTEQAKREERAQQALWLLESAEAFPYSWKAEAEKLRELLASGELALYRELTEAKAALELARAQATRAQGTSSEEAAQASLKAAKKGLGQAERAWRARDKG